MTATQQTATWSVMVQVSTDVAITHHDWQTDPEAIARPWGVMVAGCIVMRHKTAGDAGTHATAIGLPVR